MLQGTVLAPVSFHIEGPGTWAHGAGPGAHTRVTTSRLGVKPGQVQVGGEEEVGADRMHGRGQGRYEKQSKLVQP